MKYKVFIDGQEGTTGLQLQSRLARHSGVELLSIDAQRRKETAPQRQLMNEADVAFLCLPDEAAIQAAALVENPHTVVIDASTAHRTAPGWTYGFAELSPIHRRSIQNSRRIANPGCHATGFIAAAYPLVALGVAPRDYPFTCHSVSGYSGGGKKMIAQYEGAGREAALDSPRQYGLTLKHKHLPEMQKISGLDFPPVFNPIVGDFYCGMAVSVPLLPRLFSKPMTRAGLEEALKEYYAAQPLICVEGIPEGMIAANELAGTCKLKLYVTGNDEQITLVSVFDNLGKGASGAAVQNMNIALGFAETESLAEGE